MRNLAVYPITAEEIKKVLANERLDIEDWEKYGIGSIDPYVLESIFAYADAHIDDLVEFMKLKPAVKCPSCHVYPESFLHRFSPVRHDNACRRAPFEILASEVHARSSLCLRV